jgi:hypothetical protein
VYYWWNPGGDTSWHVETVAAASGSVEYSDPTIAWTGSDDTGYPSVTITATRKILLANTKSIMQAHASCLPLFTRTRTAELLLPLLQGCRSGKRTCAPCLAGRR